MNLSFAGKKEYAEHVPKLHHKFWMKLEGLFISELTSAYKYFHTLRDWNNLVLLVAEFVLK